MLEVKTREIPDGVIVSIIGDVDLYSSPEVRNVVMELAKKKIPNILIDFNRVGYMDSSGVATLVEGLQQVGKYRGKLILFGLQDLVKQVFELSRLDKVFEIHPDESTALAHLKKP